MWRLGLAACLLVMELGWLALWPLSLTLSHSAAFTAAMVEKLPIHLGQAPITASPGDPAFAAPTVALCATLIVLGAAYLLALAALGHGPTNPAAVVAAAIVFQLTLALLPGLFSQDVFSYIAYGRLSVTYDLNPYIWPPSAIAKDPILPWVAEVWRTYPAPYGPLWLDVQWLMSRLTDSLPIASQAVAYRAFANLLLLANLALLWHAARHLAQRDRTLALAILAWNPLVLFEVAANAHNDVLMVTFALMALLVVTKPRKELSVAVFTLGALVKYLSAPAIAWLAVADFAQHRRVARLIVTILVATTITALAAIPWLELPDSLDPLVNETAGVGYVNALANNFTVALADRLRLPVEPTRAAERTVIVLAFVAYLAWEARQVLRLPRPQAVTPATLRTVLVYILVVSTSVQPWYFCLPIALAATLGWRSQLAQVTLGYGLLALPALYAHYYLREATPAWVDLIYALAPLAWAAIHPLGARAGSHEPAAGRVGHDHDGPERHRLAGAVVEKAGR